MLTFWPEQLGQRGVSLFDDNVTKCVAEAVPRIQAACIAWLLKIWGRSPLLTSLVLSRRVFECCELFIFARSSDTFQKHQVRCNRSGEAEAIPWMQHASYLPRVAAIRRIPKALFPLSLSRAWSPCGRSEGPPCLSLCSLCLEEPIAGVRAQSSWPVPVRQRRFRFVHGSPQLLAPPQHAPRSPCA